MITIKKEINLHEFNTWSGATDTVKYLTSEELEMVQDYIVECFPEGMTETELNDFLWFEDDVIADILGYESFEEIVNR